MTKRPATVLVGHGSVMSESGHGMMQVAETLRALQVTPIVEAGFLNYSTPTFAEAVARACSQGATGVVVLPYFLVAGVYVKNDLPAMVRQVAADHPGLRWSVADAFLEDQRIVNLALKRLADAGAQPGPETGLLFAAHGTPLAAANRPIEWTLGRTQKQGGFGAACIGYLDCNAPDIPTAIDKLVETGVRSLAILPYFLQLGRHVRRDLPAHFAAAQQRHPQVAFQIAHFLDYDPLLAEVAAERILASLTC